MSTKAIPSGRQINSKDPVPFDFCNVTHLSIKNKSNGIVYYSFNGGKFELDPKEEDIYPSPENAMDGKIEFMIPQATTIINIKVKTVKKL